jgi:hypothetical protein
MRAEHLSVFIDDEEVRLAAAAIDAEIGFHCGLP